MDYLQRPDLKLYYERWEAEEPVANLLLVHGMAEHPARYADFARSLNQAGISVLAPAHRGHGRTGEEIASLGHMGDGDGWALVLSDLSALVDLLWKEGRPLLLLGHSMGSFLSRCLLQERSEAFAGAIIMGTAGPANGEVRLLHRLAKLFCCFQGERRCSPLLNKIAGSKQLKGMKEAKTAFDWLNRDEAEVARYIADPLCGFPCSNGFFRDITSGWIQFSDAEKNRNIRKDLPLLLISGEADPVGDHGRGVEASAKAYRDLGLKEVRLRLYPGARHEILNEINKEDVYRDCLSFLLEAVATSKK